MQEHGNYYKSIIRLFAFMAKYGHQSIPDMMNIPLSLLVDVADGINTIMDEERQQFEESRGR